MWEQSDAKREKKEMRQGCRKGGNREREKGGKSVCRSLFMLLLLSGSMYMLFMYVEHVEPGQKSRRRPSRRPASMRMESNFRMRTFCSLYFLSPVVMSRVCRRYEWATFASVWVCTRIHPSIRPSGSQSVDRSGQFRQRQPRTKNETWWNGERTTQTLNPKPVDISRRLHTWCPYWTMNELRICGRNVAPLSLSPFVCMNKVFTRINDFCPDESDKIRHLAASLCSVWGKKGGNCIVTESRSSSSLGGERRVNGMSRVCGCVE